MRTNVVTRIAIMALALVLALPALALADVCTQCGQETGSQDYVCTPCLLKLLEEKDLSGGLTVDAPRLRQNGFVTVSWKDTQHNAPYNVYYQLLGAASSVPFGWTAAVGVAGNRTNLTRLVPGMSYVITVEDAAGHRVQTTYIAPKPGEDHEIGARIRFKTMHRIFGDRATNVDLFSAAEIMADGPYEHGLYLRLTYSMLRNTRNYTFLVTVEAPNGFADTIFAGSLELLQGKSAIPVWGFIPMDDYFNMLEKYYGGVPMGTYTVTMHFDGEVVDSDTFNVGK